MYAMVRDLKLSIAVAGEGSDGARRNKRPHVSIRNNLPIAPTWDESLKALGSLGVAFSILYAELYDERELTVKLGKLGSKLEAGCALIKWISGDDKAKRGTSVGLVRHPHAPISRQCEVQKSYGAMYMYTVRLQTARRHFSHVLGRELLPPSHANRRSTFLFRGESADDI
jgi:hypothetical protein